MDGKSPYWFQANQVLWCTWSRWRRWCVPDAKPDSNRGAQIAYKPNHYPKPPNYPNSTRMWTIQNVIFAQPGDIKQTTNALTKPKKRMELSKTNKRSEVYSQSKCRVAVPRGNKKRHELLKTKPIAPTDATTNLPAIPKLQDEVPMKTVKANAGEGQQCHRRNRTGS